MKVKSVEFKCDDSMHMKAIAILIESIIFESRIWLTQGDRKANARVCWGSCPWALTTVR